MITRSPIVTRQRALNKIFEEEKDESSNKINPNQA